MSRPSKSQKTRGSYSKPSCMPVPPRLDLAYLKECFSTETHPQPHAGKPPTRQWFIVFPNGQTRVEEAATKSEARARLKAKIGAGFMRRVYLPNGLHISPMRSLTEAS
jgi:hypothetical protein